jgi:hypothetical protein
VVDGASGETASVAGIDTPDEPDETLLWWLL